MPLDEALARWRNGEYSGTVPVIREFAESNVPDAQFTLALILWFDGWGAERDIQQSISWCRKAVANGHLHATLHLAFAMDPTNEMYENAKDAAEADALYRKAFEGFRAGALSGVPEYMYSLANCLLSGWGCERSQDEAVYWFRRSEELGYNPYHGQGRNDA